MSPIKPENRGRYPKNWREVRAEILARAGNRCEGAPLHYPDCRAENGKPHPVTGSMVVLTIAHLDQVIEHNDPSNLRALCQRCHLRHDREWRRAERARNERAVVCEVDELERLESEAKK